MTTAEELAREMEADDADEERRMLEKLLSIFNARQMKKVDDEYSPQVRQYLEQRANGGDHEPLIDGEHGIVARLGKRSQTTTDCRPLGVGEVVYLHELGLLRIDVTGFNAMRKSAPSTTLDAIAATSGVFVTSESSSLHVDRMAK